ncbi:MAG: AMP-binding protein [Microthrixaceae bacterium]
MLAAVELDVASICEAIADRQPDADCLLFRDRILSWAQVQDRTRRLARVVHDAGLGPQKQGDWRLQSLSVHPWESHRSHVALYLLNGNEYLESMLGCWKAGTVPFNVNYRYVAEELTYLLNDSGARGIIIHERFVPVLNSVLRKLRSPLELIIQVADGSGNGLLPGAVDYEDALVSTTSNLPDFLIGGWSGDDPYLCYTGGTTGMPKGAIWRQADFLVSALGVRSRSGDEFQSIDELLENASGRVRAVPAPPLMHGAAHWNALSTWIAGGAVIIQNVVDHFDPEDILSTVERSRATSLLLVGDPMARPLLDQLKAEKEAGQSRELGTLRYLLSGGAVLSEQVQSELLDFLPDLSILDVLGSTESGRQGVARRSAGTSDSLGFVPASTSVVLSEDLARTMSPGDQEAGWLAQSGRVPLGYLGDRAKTLATFPVIDGIRYAIPGDRARLTQDGMIELLGRDSACITTGGEKVFAEEVETAVKSHPEVFDAVVCGRPSDLFGSEVVAIVQVRPGSSVSDEQIRSSAEKHIARYKLPRAIIRREQIVRSPSGKADYRWAAEQVKPV